MTLLFENQIDNIVIANRSVFVFFVVLLVNNVLVGLEEYVNAVEAHKAHEPEADRANGYTGHFEGERNGEEACADVAFDHVHHSL